MQKGIDAYQRDDFRQCVNELEVAVQKGTDRFSLEIVLTVLGNAYDKLDLHSEALASYQLALETNPDYYKAWVGQGISQRSLGDYRAAERCYNEAMRINPNYAELHTSLGAMYIFLGRAEQAVQALEKAITLDPSVAISYGNIALAYAMLGRFDEAEKALQQATVLGYKNFKIVKERIAALKLLG